MYLWIEYRAHCFWVCGWTIVYSQMRGREVTEGQDTACRSWPPGSVGRASAPGSGQQSSHLFPILAESPALNRKEPCRKCLEVACSAFNMEIIENWKDFQKFVSWLLKFSVIFFGINGSKMTISSEGEKPLLSRSIKFQLSKVITCTDLLYNSVTAVHDTVLYTWNIKRTDLLIRTWWAFLPKLKRKILKNKKNLDKDREKKRLVPW